MQCRIEGHQNKPIEGFCVNSECDHQPCYCRKCYREFHNEHLGECILFDEGTELLGTLLQNQESLKNGLSGLLQTIQVKSGILIQNLERNIRIIKDLNDMLKEQRLDDIKKNVILIKHYYGFQVQAQSGYGTKIENVIHDFQKIQEELEGQIKLLSNPASLYITKGLELLNDKQYEKAILQLDKAINLDSLSVDALILKAKALRNIKIYDQAQKLIDQALKINNNNPKIYLEQGNLLRDQNKFKEALVQFEEQLKLDQNNSEGVLGKADSLLGLNEYNDAVILYEQILKNDGKNVFALIGNAQALMKLNQNNRALEMTYNAITVDPKNEKAYYYSAIIMKDTLLQRLKKNEINDPQYSFETNLSECLIHFQRVFELNPENYEAIFLCVQMRLQISQDLKRENLIPDAVKLIEIILKKDPSNVKAYQYMGKALIQTQKPGEALKYCDMGLQINPDDEDLKIIKNQAQNGSIELQMNTLIDQDKFDEVMTLLSTNNFSDEAKIEAYDYIGYKLICQGKFIEALDYLSKLQKLNEDPKYQTQFPESRLEDLKRGLTRICRELIQVKQYNKVIEAFDIITKLPYCCYSSYHNFKGDALLSTRRYDEALIAYKEMLKGNQVMKIQYWQRAGHVLLKKLNFNEAIKYYEQSIRGTEELIKTNNEKKRKGMIANGKPDPQTGETNVFDLNLQQMLCLDQSYFHKGIALYYIKEYTTALSMFNESLSLNPEEASVYYMKSLALTQLGYNEQAQQNLAISRRKGFMGDENHVFGPEQYELQLDAVQLIQQKKFTEAIPIYERLIELNPKFIGYYQHCLQLLFLSNNYERCLEVIDKAIKVDPQNQNVYDLQIILMKQRVGQLISAKQCGKALTTLKKGFRIDPKKLEEFSKQDNFFDQIGIGLLNNHQYKKAVEAFGYQIQLYEQLQDKNYKNAIYFKCLSLYRLQQYDQVMQIIEDLITQSDCKAQVFCLLGDSSIILIGDTLFMKQKYVEAIIGYQEALSKEFNFLQYINIGDCLAQTQQYQEAIEQYDILLSSDQQIDQNLKNMASMHKAQVLITQEQYQQAIQLLKQVLDLNPKNSLAYYHLSQTLQKMGITNEASEALEKARLNGLEINDQTQPLLMNISGLSSDNNVPVHPYQ